MPGLALLSESHGPLSCPIHRPLLLLLPLQMGLQTGAATVATFLFVVATFAGGARPPPASVAALACL